MARQRIFAGNRLKQLRHERAIKQADFAETLGISTSYLSQIEHDDRPLTPALLDRLQRLFPLEWEEVAAEAGDRRAGALREAAADPLFAASPLPPNRSSAPRFNSRSLPNSSYRSMPPIAAPGSDYRSSTRH